MLENSQTKKYYKADEIANALGVKKFVIRTWEKQFELNRTESQYNEADLKIFEAIRDLLYEQKLSPTVAKQKLPDLLLQKTKELEASTSETVATPQEMAPIVAEIVQSEPIEASPAQELVPQVLVEFTQETSKIEEPEEEIVAATRSEEVAENQVQPAFKQNEEFWNNLKSFKEQLLKIQEQLK